MHVLLAAVPEHLRVCPAAVEAEHDLRARRAAFLSSASAFGSVTLSPDGSPVTKHTARPS